MVYECSQPASISITFAHPHIDHEFIALCVHVYGPENFLIAIMSGKEHYILSHHVQTYIYILHSLTSLFITLCVFLHLSGEEHTGCHS